MLEKPGQMLSSPSPRGLSLPAICNISLDKRRLPQMALPRRVRSGKHAIQEQLHIEWLAHVRPPM